MAEDDTIIEKGEVKLIMDSQAPCFKVRKSTMSTVFKAPAFQLRIHRRRPRAAAAARSARSCADTDCRTETYEGPPRQDRSYLSGPGF